VNLLALLSVSAVAALVLVAALVVVVLLVLLLVRSGESSTFHDAEPEPAPPPAAEPAAVDPAGAIGLRRAFRRAMARLDRHAAGPEPRYRLPWMLLLGEEGSRPRDLLARSGLVLPFGEPDDARLPEASRCDWWFLERGVVVDLGGGYLAGAAPGSHSLRAVSRLLERSRPGRPLDGVILTVSAIELHRAELAGTAGTSRLEERAAAVSRELRQAQKRLGFTLPVYVLVTGCEAVPGFADLARAVPEARRREMLGWSSPYSVDSAYRGEWVREAFASLGARLERIQAEIFAETGNGVDPDRVFVLPQAFASLERPLRSSLDPVFRPSSYHESLWLRGVYFCGALANGDGSARAPVLFVRDLLERKVFPEAGLARPLAATLVARNRRLAGVQAAVLGGALLLAAGVWWAHARLERGRRVLEPVLAEIASDVADAKQHGGATREEQAEWSKDLFASMAAIDVDWFGSIFLPSSWVSPLDRRLEQAFVEAFDHVVFKAMGNELESYAGELTAVGSSADPWAWPTAGGSSAPGAVAPTVRPAATGAAPASAPRFFAADVAPAAVESTPQFRSLATYVADVRDLERIVPIYNGLADSPDLSDLGEVAEWLFEVPLPDGFFDHRRLYAKAQRKAHHRELRLEAYQEPARAKAEALGAALDRRLFEDDELAASLSVVETGLGALATQGWASRDDGGRVEALAVELRHLEDLLSDPAIAWALGSRFAPGPAYWALLGQVEESPVLLGHDVADRMRRATELEWIRYRRGLERFGSGLTGPILTFEGGGARLSDDLLVVESSLGRFLDQGFAAEAEPAWLIPEVPPGSDLVWDLDLLQRAVALYEPYQRFREGTLPQSPPEVRPALDAAARERLGANTIALLARAESFEAYPQSRSAVALERRLRLRIGAFQAAAEPLTRLIAILHELGLWQVRQDLEELLVQQGGGLLGQVDRLLTARDPYRPRAGGFNWWDGSAAVGLAAFDAKSREDLATYLELQRRQLESVARDYAEPLVGWLEQTGAGSDPAVRDLVRKWDGILAALDDYAGEKPGNSVARLEEFIGQDLAAASLDDCFSLGGGATPASVSDYFLESRERLASELLSRCRTLAADRAEERYAELAALFNRRLAGRFPFADAPGGGGRTEAAPEDVAGFFRSFDRSAPLLRAVGTGDGEGGPGLPRTVLDFVDQMTRVRAFFAPFLDAEEPSPEPLYDVEVEFRANRAAEQGGYQIIEWALEVGGERLTHRDATRRTRWGPGEPIRLTLRWAADSPREPVAPAASELRPFTAVDGHTVTYEFDDRWSLLSALQVLAADPRDLQAFTRLEPGTLQLAVTTRPAGGDRPDPDPTRVFVRLAVLAPDGTDTLVVPRFPAHAPALDGRGGKVL
jgi:type VI secretion system protein ImpL